MRYEVLTGLRYEQLHQLSLRILGRAGDVVRPGGRPAAIGLFGSVAMVVTLMRKNITQEVAGAVFGVSQATVSRRWDLLRPLIGQVLYDCVPHPAEIAGRQGTLLVDGTVCPVWDWSALPGLFSGKAGYPGMNIQIAATIAGDLAASARPRTRRPPRRPRPRSLRAEGADRRDGRRRRPRLHRRGRHRDRPVRTPPAASCMTARRHSTRTSAPSAPPSSGLSRT